MTITSSALSNSKAKRNLDRLTIQLVLFFVIPLTLVLSAIAFLAVNWHEDAMRELILVRDEGATQLAASALNARLDQYTRDLDMLQHYVASGITLDELSVTMPEFVEGFDRGVYRIDADGAACSSGTLDTITLVSAQTNPALAGCVSFEALDVLGVFNELQMDRAASIYLLDELNTIRFSLASDHEHQPDFTVLEQIDGPSDDNHGVATITDEETIVAYCTVENLGWRLVMMEPWHAVSDSQLQQSLFAPLFVIPITLLSVMMLGFGSLRVVRPLQRLRQLITELPHGDLIELRQPVGGIQEITDLQFTLVDMTGELREAQTTLREYIGAITRAQEDERFRLARDLHDDTVQTLIALNQRVQMVQRALSRKPELAEQRLSELREMVDQAIVDVRRLIHAMRPTYLADLGLVAAIRTLVQDVQSDALKAEFELQGEPCRLEDELELAFYRVAQEAISNVLRHAQAKRLQVRLTFKAAQISLMIQDNGQGFQVPPDLLTMVNSGNYGLVGISERTQLVHGDLDIVSVPSRGTTLMMRVPVMLQ